MSDYPVGAKWETKFGKRGLKGSIVLKERSKYFETWFWYIWYRDGSIPFPSCDWGTNREFVRSECLDHLGENLRFQRVKDE